jgi:SAM-dependent methyltransferase
MNRTELLPCATDVEHVSCDWCGKSETRPLLSASDFNWPLHSPADGRPADEHVWNLVRCQGCGLVYLNPRPTGDRLAAYYPQSYYAYASPGAGPRTGFKRLVRRTLRANRLLCRLALRSPLAYAVRDSILDACGWVKPGSVLDVGCGSGLQLDDLAALGWATYGVDISPEAVRAARARGHRVWLGDISAVDMDPGRMDVVRLSHVLEHVPSPRQALLAVHRLLRPGGHVLIEVPNFRTVWAPLFGGYSSMLDLPRHLYHFDPDTLQRLVRGTGFAVHRVQLLATPRFLLQSLAIAMLDAENGAGRRGEVADLLSDRVIESLGPFCRELERLSYGNNILLVGKVPQ